MINILKSALLIFSLGMVFQLFLPWWSAAIAAGIGNLFFSENSIQSVFTGVVGIGGLWLLAALWQHSGLDGALAPRISELAGVSSVFSVFLITFGIGGIIGGFGGITGYQFRRIFT